LEDLEDYFHRVDARRAEVEAEMAAEASLHHASRGCQKKGSGIMDNQVVVSNIFYFHP